MRNHQATLVAVTLLALTSLSACAVGTDASSAAARSARTLVDGSGAGEYDTWEVVPATESDPSLVILAHGPTGAEGEIRFLPFEDGSLTVVAESNGTSSELDLDDDGAFAGEAHAPESDALLAEMVTDLGDRTDELVARATATDVLPDDGAAREALVQSHLDVGCALAKVISWVLQGVDRLFEHAYCDVVPGAGDQFHFVIHTSTGTVDAARWTILSDAPKRMTVSGPPEATVTDAQVPRYATAISPGATFELSWTAEPGRPRTLTAWGIPHGRRNLEITLAAECGGQPCARGVCATAPDGRAVCTETLTDELFPRAN